MTSHCGVKACSLALASCLVAAMLSGGAEATCSKENMATWCSESPLSSARDLWSQAIAVDSESGSTFTAGHFSGRTGFRNETHSAKSGLDVFVARQTGEDLDWVFTATPWATQGGESLPIGFVSEYMKVHSVRLSPSGDALYVAGHYSGVVEAEGRRVLRSLEEISQDVFLLQLDARTGSLNWAVSVGGDSIDSATSLEVDEDNAYIAGSFFHMASFGKTVLYTPHGLEGSFLVRVSSAGSIVWAESIGNLLPDFDFTDVTGANVGLDPDGHSLRLSGTLGAPKTAAVATSSAMPSMFTAKVERNSGAYVESSQDFYAFFSTTLVASHFEAESNSLLNIFWCDDASKGVVVDAGQSLWCSENHEKVLALKIHFEEGSPEGKVAYLVEVADALTFGNGRFLEPSVMVSVRHGTAFLMGSIEGMVTFNDGSTAGHKVRSATPSVFVAHLGVDGSMTNIEMLGGESGVMLVTAMAQNRRTGGLDFTGVYKGNAKIGSAESAPLKAHSDGKWDIYTASVAQSSGSVDLHSMYADQAAQQSSIGSTSSLGIGRSVVDTLINSMTDVN